MQNLVIVESPTKARTLERFLGSDYKIIASMGHVRDLPKSEIGVDTEHEFEPKYIIPRDKRKRVNELKKEAGAAKAATRTRAAKTAAAEKRYFKRRCRTYFAGA